MTRFSTARSLMTAALALSAMAATTVMAQAHYDGRRPIAVGEPYGHPQPVPERFGRQRGGLFGDADRDGIPNRYDRDSRFFDPRETRRSAEFGDWDRDGVVNRFDRFPRNPRRS